MGGFRGWGGGRRLGIVPPPLQPFFSVSFFFYKKNYDQLSFKWYYVIKGVLWVWDEVVPLPKFSLPEFSGSTCGGCRDALVSRPCDLSLLVH